MINLPIIIIIQTWWCVLIAILAILDRKFEVQSCEIRNFSRISSRQLMLKFPQEFHDFFVGLMMFNAYVCC